MRKVLVRTALLVARKELLEALRDRRTLFVALVLPVLIYPIVVLGLGPVVSMQTRRLAETVQQVVFTGPDAEAAKAKVLVPYVRDGETEARAPALDVVTSADPRKDLEDRKIQLWVEVPDGFDEALAGERTASLTVRWDSSDDPSRAAWEKWRQAYEAAARRELNARLAARGLDQAWREPLRQEAEDVAPAEKAGAYVFGRILALLLVLMTLTSSFYPAVDGVAGEKERGTMETLLVAPCGRVELVLGKFLAVLAVTMAAAVLNLGSLSLTSGPLLGMVGSGRATLHVTWNVFVAILVLLIPLAALFSAVALSLSTLARSVKEAQHYLSPLVMVVMPLSLVVILPNLPLTPTLAAVPVTNAVLFFRDLLLGRTEWITTIIVMVSTFTFAALAIWASVLLFLREETLFRGPEGTGAIIRRPAPRPLPTAPAAVFLFATCMAGLWYAQGVLPGDIEGSVLLTQLAVILAPCLALAFWARHDFGATFRLRRPSAAAWSATALAVPLGLALPIVSTAIQQALGRAPAPEGPLRHMEEQMQALVSETPAWRLVLLLGVLPAVCEELVYRGFVLSGLEQAWTSRQGRISAVLVTAAFFAISHVFPEKWPNTFVMGIVLCVLVLRTGSLLPALVTHAVHNGVVALATKYRDAPVFHWLYGAPPAPGTVPEPGFDWVRVAAAVAVSAALLVAVHLLTRRAVRAAVRGT